MADPASPHLYTVIRAVAKVVLRLWFRVRLTGVENVPNTGPVIVAPNHKSFFDAFFVGIAAPRRVHFMAKVELIEGPLGWLFKRLGAFPVHRGEADTVALDTARELLADGELVVIFPEGTRVEVPDALGSPRHGAGRLAIETGAPIVPAAITGTSHLWRGALPRLKPVQLAFLPPVPASSLSGPEAVTELIDAQVWPAVFEEYSRLRARPGFLLAGLAALGVGGGLVGRRRLQVRSQTRLLGKLEPRRIRKQKSRRQRLRRLLLRDR